MDAVLFGVGINAKRAMSFLKQKYNILWCVDNDKSKWGTTFCGYLVNKPNDLMNFNGTIVVIAQNHTYDIVNQLEILGIDKSQINSLVCTYSGGSYSFDVYPIIKREYVISKKELWKYDLLQHEETNTNKRKILIFAKFYSVYAKQLIENVAEKFDDVELSLLTGAKESKELIQNDCLAHIYYFETMQDINTILHKLPKYDVAQLLWIEEIWAYFCEEIRDKFTKLNICVGGSDFYRASKQDLEFKRKLMDIADIITAETTETIMDFSNWYNNGNDKIKLLPFGLEVINYINDIHISKKKIREKFNIAQDKIIVTCGHNAVKSHQHLKIIECLKEIPIEVKSRTIFVFPMTYPSGREEYINEVRINLEEYEIPHVILTDFMDFKLMGEYAVISDIMIHVQTTDQLSSSMLEEMYAGSIVIAGSWLPYKMLHDRGMFLIDVDSVKDAVDNMNKVILNMNSFRNKCKKNKDIIWKYHSWSALVSQWHDIWMK